jgi:hypothetical protein
MALLMSTRDTASIAAACTAPSDARVRSRMNCPKVQ